MANVYPTKPSRLDFGGKGFDAPSVHPLRKGSTFARRVQVEGLDLTGLEIRMAVKEDYSQTPEIFFSTENTAPDGVIIIDPDVGEWFELQLDADETALLDAGGGNCQPRQKKYKYDLELVTPQGEVYAFLEGQFYIVDEITTES
jgi:hypothetical protein